MKNVKEKWEVLSPVVRVLILTAAAQGLLFGSLYGLMAVFK